MKTTPEIQQTAGSRRSPASCSASLRVPKKRPDQWAIGDIAIEYITLRRDDDPMPPCILLMVTRIEGDLCHCQSLDQYRPMTMKANHLMGVAEAVDYFERGADEMTVRSYRLGKQNLEALATPFAPLPEWIRTMGFWEERPEDRPDDWDVLRKFIPLITEGDSQSPDQKSMNTQTNSERESVESAAWFAVALPDTRGRHCYLTRGDGDPPRTYDAKHANRYKTRTAAEAAIVRARKTTPFRERTMIVVPYPHPANDTTHP